MLHVAISIADPASSIVRRRHKKCFRNSNDHDLFVLINKVNIISKH